MRISARAIIPSEKLTRYLLVPREQDDKSKFLSFAGFTRQNPELLLQAIRRLIENAQAVEEGHNAYGRFFRIDGILEGTEGRELSVTTIWLRWETDGQFHFVTLKPLKRG